MGKVKISACVLTRDDFPFLRNCIPAVRKIADEIIVVETGSRDQTVPWLNRQGIQTISVPASSVPNMGFGYLRNLATERFTGDWIYHVDSDEMIDPNELPRVRPILESCPSDSVALNVATFRFNRRFNVEDWTAISRRTPYEYGLHVRFYRNNAGIEWRGYIHEELWKNDVRQFETAFRAPVRHLHFTNYRTWGNPHHKALRVGYMMYRAYMNPELGKFLSPWWFQNWFPTHLALCKRQAEEYERNRSIIDPD